MWAIVKGINKNRQSKVQSQIRINDGNVISNKQIMSENIDDFFVNICPIFADKILKKRQISSILTWK